MATGENSQSRKSQIVVQFWGNCPGQLRVPQPLVSHGKNPCILSPGRHIPHLWILRRSGEIHTCWWWWGIQKGCRWAVNELCCRRGFSFRSRSHISLAATLRFLSCADILDSTSLEAAPPCFLWACLWEETPKREVSGVKQSTRLRSWYIGSPH